MNEKSRGDRGTTKPVTMFKSNREPAAPDTAPRLCDRMKTEKTGPRQGRSEFGRLVSAAILVGKHGVNALLQFLTRLPERQALGRNDDLVARLRVATFI